MNVLIDLFITFFTIGAFSFGGGYAMLPLMKREIIEIHNWLTNAEFIDILAISEVTPGPIAINTATFLGYRISGLVGSIVATIGVVLPSFIIMGTIVYFLFKFEDSPYLDWFFIGIRPIVLGLIGAASISIAMDSFIDIKSILIAIVLFYLVSFRKTHPILAIILAGVAGTILY
ncbi:MAG: chromate transporter [Tissierellia bacterium]|nr:chromate transporter [Tissierellia bacterium]